MQKNMLPATRLCFIGLLYGPFLVSRVLHTSNHPELSPAPISSGFVSSFCFFSLINHSISRHQWKTISSQFHKQPACVVNSAQTFMSCLNLPLVVVSSAHMSGEPFICDTRTRTKINFYKVSEPPNCCIKGPFRRVLMLRL